MLNFSREAHMLREMVEDLINIYEEMINDNYFHSLQYDLACQRCEFLESILDQIEEFEQKIQTLIDESEQ
jgi:hypothetical protein